MIPAMIMTNINFLLTAGLKMVFDFRVTLRLYLKFGSCSLNKWITINLSWDVKQIFSLMAQLNNLYLFYLMNITILLEAKYQVQ